MEKKRKEKKGKELRNTGKFTLERFKFQETVLLEKENTIKEWIEGLLATKTDLSLINWIKDGTVLCKLINRLYPGIIRKFDESPSLMRIKMIQNFHKFFQATTELNLFENYSGAVFTLQDIFEGKNEEVIIKSLFHLFELSNQNKGKKFIRPAHKIKREPSIIPKNQAISNILEMRKKFVKKPSLGNLNTSMDNINPPLNSYLNMIYHNSPIVRVDGDDHHPKDEKQIILSPKQSHQNNNEFCAIGRKESPKMAANKPSNSHVRKPNLIIKESPINSKLHSNNNKHHSNNENFLHNQSLSKKSNNSSNQSVNIRTVVSKTIQSKLNNQQPSSNNNIGIDDDDDWETDPDSFDTTQSSSSSSSSSSFSSHHKSNLSKLSNMSIGYGYYEPSSSIDQKKDCSEYISAFGVRRGKCLASFDDKPDQPCPCPSYYPRPEVKEGGECMNCGHYPIRHDDLGPSSPFDNTYNNINNNGSNNWIVPFDQLQLSFIIGSGASGEVYRGKLWGVEVAIKKLDDTSPTEDFQNEISLLASIRHPNCVLFIAATRSPLCIVTELFNRGSLLDIISDQNMRSVLSWEQRVDFAIDACLGMIYLHHLNIVHRDLKTANLLVDDNWRVAVGDFGLSEVVTYTNDSTLNPNNVVGTFGYMAPEVILGNSATFASDVYSFGIILWELFTGCVVNEVIGYDELAIQAYVLRGERPDIPSIFPALLKNLIENCWSEDPKVRPSFEEIVVDLRKLSNMNDNSIVEILYGRNTLTKRKEETRSLRTTF